MRLGIDFGTTNSAAAVYDGSQLHPIRIKTAAVGEQSMLPSLIYVDKDHQVTLGQDAAQTYVRKETGRAVRWANRSIGMIEITVAGTGSSPITYAQEVFIAYDEAANGRLLQSIKTALRNREYHGTQIFDRFYTLDELIAMLLGRFKRDSEQQFGQVITEVVIGRPVKFSDDPRVSLRAEEIIYKAARKVGFRDISFHMEPIGALYVYHVSEKRRRKALVFDFGGGTLDLTVAEVGGGIKPEVLATVGVLVGGDDLDKRIMRSLYPYFGEDQKRGEMLPYDIANALTDWQMMPELTRPQFQETFKFLHRTHPRPQTISALETLISKNVGFSLFREIERVKRELTDQDSAELHFIYEHINIHETYTRERFERMIAPEVQQVGAGIQQVLAEAATNPAEIDVVLRTGGSSLVPAFVRMLTDLFGHEKLSHMDPFISVTGGLGVIAYENGGMYGHGYMPKYRDEPLPVKSTGKQPPEIYTAQVDALCYVERETIIRRLPIDLCGLRAIRVCNLDSEATDENFLTITLDQPGRIYVAYASAATRRPKWLRDFENEDKKVDVIDDWWGVKELQVFSREFDAGTITLGANRAEGAEGKCDPHYLVFIEG